MLLTPLVWMVVAQVPAVPLTGTVVGPAGEPVVGAELVLVGLPSYDPPVVARGQSGEGGRFSLDRPAALAGDHDPQRAHDPLGGEAGVPVVGDPIPGGAAQAG